MSQLKRKFRALIVDCDGTLMISQRDGYPSAEVTRAIGKAAKIVHVGIATQRSIANARPILEHLNLSGPSIIAGGAQVIDSQNFTMIREELINKDSLAQTIKVMTKFKQPIIFIESNGDHSQWSDGYIPEKITGVFMGSLAEDVADQLKGKLSKIPDVAIQKVIPWGGQFGIAVNAALATKQHGIFEVAKILGIKTDQIIGVGDSYNDFPLLMACGLRVAMGNAVEDLKAIADYVAPSVEEDGVVDVINKFILA